jgi:hypothetical protein
LMIDVRQCIVLLSLFDFFSLNGKKSVPHLFGLETN